MTSMQSKQRYQKFTLYLDLIPSSRQSRIRSFEFTFKKVFALPSFSTNSMVFRAYWYSVLCSALSDKYFFITFIHYSFSCSRKLNLIKKNVLRVVARPLYRVILKPCLPISSFAGLLFFHSRHLWLSALVQHCNL